jgi:hypothetical protein
LLTEVRGSEEATVRAKNEYFLKRELYFAKRHRIVKVNADVLKSEEAITIALFDGTALTLEVTSLKVDSNGFITAWEGTIPNPPISAEDLLDQVSTIEEARFLHSAMFTISIAATRYDYDEATGVSTPSYISKRTPKQNPEQGDLSISIFYGIHANISVPTLPERYWIRSLELSPKYHLLIEVDDSKTFPPGPLYDAEHPEIAERRRRYVDFLQSIGEDPRKAKILREEPR